MARSIYYIIIIDALIYELPYFNLYQFHCAIYLVDLKPSTIIRHNLLHLISPRKCRQGVMFPNIFMLLWEYLREIKASQNASQIPLSSRGGPKSESGLSAPVPELWLSTSKRYTHFLFLFFCLLFLECIDNVACFFITRRIVMGIV